MRKLTWYAPGYVSDVTTPTLKFEFSNNTIYFIEQIDGLGAPTLTAQTQGLPLQNGSVFARAKYEPRVISISGQIRKKGIADINAGKAAMSLALAQNVNMSRETWQADFTNLAPAYSGIDSFSEWQDFLFNINGLGILKYESTGVTVTKRINAYVSMGPVFKSKVGTDPYQAFTVEFTCPYPFWEDDAYTNAISTTTSGTSNFTIGGDVPPRIALIASPYSSPTYPISTTSLKIMGKAPYSPTIASAAYQNTMIEYENKTPINLGLALYQSFIRGELQSYTVITSTQFYTGASSTQRIYYTTGSDPFGYGDPTGMPINAIAKAPSINIFVAVSNASPYLKYGTTPAAAMATASTVVGTAWNSVAWSSKLGLFVTVGSATPYIATSPDGNVWTAATTVVGTSWNEVIWVDDLSMFIAVGSASPYIAYSLDGVTWVAAIGAASANTYDVAWSKKLGKLIAVNAGSSSKYMESSFDGITWTPITGVSVSRICRSDQLGIFVASASGTAYRSFDGVSWIASTVTGSETIVDVAWSQNYGLFAATGSGGGIYNSYDGITWTNVNTFSGVSFTKIFSFPDEETNIDSTNKITKMTTKELPPGDYQATYFALDNSGAAARLSWTLFYRKAWLGV